MIKEETHIFQGMKRDSHQIRQDSKYLWDARNIRITNREDNTLLSITNEKGTSDSLLTLKSKYVGHCVLGDYLIVFTGNEDKSNNHIYRISKDNKVKDLFGKTEVWDKGWTPLHPIETIGIFETSLIQKVYWVDGINSPRVINVVKDKLLDDTIAIPVGEYIYKDTEFDFVPTLKLQETVEINRLKSSGTFSPGTIQYAFAYFNKYGQESNIFYTTELFYITYNDRGGSPEDNINTAFKIHINNTDSSFEYIRVYSIHRTSIDATPEVKVVTDLRRTDEVDYIDNGRNGYTIDPTQLLYIGGEDIIANTLIQKDNTLFLGNISINRPNISKELKNFFKSGLTINANTRDINIYTIPNTFYSYTNQLQYGNTSYFRKGNTYRLGLQFQYKNGKWSEPCFIKDFDMDGDRPTISDTILKLPDIKTTLKGLKTTFGGTISETPIIEIIKSLGYKRVRPVIVQPSMYEKMVLAQGIVCPTVFSIKDRLSNSPFAQASWFFRPMLTEDINNKDKDGSNIEYHHLRPLLSGDNKGAEIQNMEPGTFNEKFNDKLANTFFIDQSIFTVNSPDIEFNDEVQLTLDKLSKDDFKFNIIGIIPFTATASNINITTSSPAPAAGDLGFYHRTLLSTDSSGRSIVSGLYYKSHIIDEKKNADEYYVVDYRDPDKEANWLIYPWHRTGSLNNDVERGANKGIRTANLKRKVISNLRFSPNIKWLNNPWSTDKTTDIGIFNSNEVSLIKLDTDDSNKSGTINYFGNVDSMITTTKKYPFYLTPNSGKTIGGIKGTGTDIFVNGTLHKLNDFYVSNKSDTTSSIGDYNNALCNPTDPVRIKYKSTPHAIIALNYTNGNQNVLPSIGNTNIVDSGLPKPYWIDNINIESKPDNYTKINGLYNSLNELKHNLDIAIEHQYGIVKNNNTYILYTNVEVEDATGTKSHIWQEVKLPEPGVTNYYEEGQFYYFKVDKNTLKLVSIGDTLIVNQDKINYTLTDEKNFLYLAEIVRKKKPSNMYGGITDEALQNNLWIPAGKITNLDEDIEFIYGDTYYQRYDCLKTYPFTTEDENSVVDIASFMCETYVNIDGRYDRNRSQLDNLNMSPINFNLLNKVYSQKDNFFNYRIYDSDYYKQHSFNTQITWSLVKNAGESIDNWTNITLANTLDLDGEYGNITALTVWNDTLLCFQEKACNQILFNSRVQIPVSDGTPIEISNGMKVDGSRIISNNIGCSNKWSIINTNSGLYFIDNITDSIYSFDGKLNNISDSKSMSWWVKNSSEDIWNPINKGIRSFYDSIYGDIYFTPMNEDSLCYSEKLGEFISFLSYGGTQAMFNFNGNFYSLRNDGTTTKLYQNNVGKYNNFFGSYKDWSISFISNDNPTYTKIFDNIELRTDHNNNSILLNDCPYNYIYISNEYQSGETIVDNYNTRKKFRIWRSILPRNKNSRERIRNLWSMITIGRNVINEESNKAVIHDVTVKYTI